MLELDQLSVQRAGREVVTGVSLQLEPGAIACLLGPSGGGKTTLLRTIAGFEAPSHGCIKLDARRLSDPGSQLPPAQRGIGMVFQDLALLPHLNLRENVGFGLYKWPKADRRERVDELLQLVGLEEAAARYPQQLSGGQQQRIALARALAPKPKLLLLDEPLSGLDATLRPVLAEQLVQILRASATTTLLVTHDQHEAFAFADSIGVLCEGRLQQWGSATELYRAPANRTVGGFVGEGVFLSGRVEADGWVRTALGRVQPSSGTTTVGMAVEVLLRPENVVHDDRSGIQATVRQHAFRGAMTLYRLELPEGELVSALWPSSPVYPIGAGVPVALAGGAACFTVEA